MHGRAQGKAHAVVYPVGILSSCYHLANGFWTMAITWGLTISAGAQRRWGYVCGGLFVLARTSNPDAGTLQHAVVGERSVAQAVVDTVGEWNAAEAGPGSFFHIPEGTWENFEPLEQTRLLVIYTPGGMDKFFEEAGEPAERREIPPPSDAPPDLERLTAIAEKHGLELRVPAEA